MSSDKVKRALKVLLKHEDNRYCADCPQKKPTWASINLGVFLCLHCAGIHRDMGVHISKVRSVELDTWQPEWVKVMQKWGNRRANKYWEANIPANYDGRPTEAEAQALSQKLKKFIRDKYEKKKWAASSTAGVFDDAQSTSTAAPQVRATKPRRPKQRQAVTHKPKPKPKPKPKQAVEEEVDLFGSFDPQPPKQQAAHAPTPPAAVRQAPATHNSKAASIMAMYQKNAGAATVKPTPMYNMANANAAFAGLSVNGNGQRNPGMQPQQQQQQVMGFGGQQQMQQPMMANGMMHGNMAYPQGMQTRGQTMPIPMPMQQASQGGWPQQTRQTNSSMQQGYPAQMQNPIGANVMQPQLQPGQFQPYQMPSQGMQRPNGVPSVPQNAQAKAQSMPQTNQYDPFASLT